MVPFSSFPFGQTPLASSRPNQSRWGVCVTVVWAECVCDRVETEWYE